MSTKNELNCLKYGYLNWRCIGSNISQFFRNLKYAYQRVVRGYCDQDLWNLNYYLGTFLHITLTDLAENHIGYPCNHTSVKSDEDWTKILLEMAEHFRNATDPDDTELAKETDRLFDIMGQFIIGQREVKNDNGTFSVEYSYSDEAAYNKAREAWWTATKKQANFVQAETVKALQMFSKYYNNLWD